MWTLSWSLGKPGARTTTRMPSNIRISHLEAFAPLWDDCPEDFTYPLFPEPGGQLPWASTGDGDQLCWLTGGEPDNWPAVEWNIRDPALRSAPVCGHVRDNG